MVNTLIKVSLPRFRCTADCSPDVRLRRSPASDLIPLPILLSLSSPTLVPYLVTLGLLQQCMRPELERILTCPDVNISSTAALKLG